MNTTIHSLTAICYLDYLDASALHTSQLITMYLFMFKVNNYIFFFLMA